MLTRVPCLFPASFNRKHKLSKKGQRGATSFSKNEAMCDHIGILASIADQISEGQLNQTSQGNALQTRALSFAFRLARSKRPARKPWAQENHARRTNARHGGLTLQSYFCPHIRAEQAPIASNWCPSDVHARAGPARLIHA